MGNKSGFGVVTGLCCTSFVLLLTATIWTNIPQLSAESDRFIGLMAAILVVDGILDFILFSKGRERGTSIKKLRYVAIISVLVWVIMSFLGPAPFPRNLAPNIFNFFATAAFIVCSTLVFRFRSAIILPENADNLRKSAPAVIALATLTVLVGSYFSIPSFFCSVLLIISIYSGLGLIAVAHIFKDESRFAAFSIASPGSRKNRRFNWALAIVGTGLIPALLLAGNHSPLTTDTISSFFAWVSSVVTGSGKADKTAMNDVVDHAFPQQRTAEKLSKIAASISTSPFWPIFYQVLTYTGIVVLIGALFYFMIRPFVTREMRLRVAFSLFFKQFYTLFTQPFVKFWHFLLSIQKIFTQKKGEKTAYVQRNAVRPKEYLNALRAVSRASGTKKTTSDADDSLSLYFRFLEWAYEGGVQWKLSDTPVDILEKITEMVRSNMDIAGSSNPELSARLGRAVTELVERDLFSRTPIGTTGCQEMKSAIDQLCSLPSMSRSRAASS